MTPDPREVSPYRYSSFFGCLRFRTASSSPSTLGGPGLCLAHVLHLHEPAGETSVFVANRGVGHAISSLPLSIHALPRFTHDSCVGGDDFCKIFLGPSMVHTPGVIKDPNRAETLEALQENELVVAKITRVTFWVHPSHNQTVSGNKRIGKTGGDPKWARIEYYRRRRGSSGRPLVWR